MAVKTLLNNTQANEAVSKYKLLSAYGGPGSLVHTQYGSIIISCIEEWGFLKKVIELHEVAVSNPKLKTEAEQKEYVEFEAKLSSNGSITISNDYRLIQALRDRKKLINLKYLSLIPDLSLNEFGNTIKETLGATFSIPSTFMPKIFKDKTHNYKSYAEWFNFWVASNENDPHGNKFFPPKKYYNEELIQDNIILICERGHISDFPWSKFLRWRKDFPLGILKNEAVDLFTSQHCCGSDDRPTSKIKITSNTANASGFDGKYLKCDNCGKSTSLQGLMSVKIKCPGHTPWEDSTVGRYDYSGNNHIRNGQPRTEKCTTPKPMKVALTTGNNLYYSRITSSIFLPIDLYKDEIELKLEKFEIQKKDAMRNDNLELAIELKKEIELLIKEKPQELKEELSDKEKEVLFRFQEFKAFREKSVEEINTSENDLKVKDVTRNLDNEYKNYFNKVLRIDTMKITSAQLDFSRVFPADSDAPELISKNIFRSKKPENVLVYPVVENFGEGIFFSFNEKNLNEYLDSEGGANIIKELQEKLSKLNKGDDFSRGAIEYGESMNWQLYLVHSFTHLIMRELEFRCGYPTASLSERIYVSNDDKYKMYGCLIYTAEGAEGSMGGLIAQTREKNLNNLIKSAIHRATICHSDPLCWESEGQGLFDLNFAACFSCSLVSETSCEHRNLYLDRKILVDENGGFFKDIINKEY